MKHLFKNVVLFICLFFTVILVIQIAISTRIKGKSVTGFDTLDTTENINADLVFIGSSRCWAHFDPNFFEENYNLKSVNIGMSGFSEIEPTKLRLKNYLAKNKKPKYVIFNIDPFLKATIKKNKNLINKNSYSVYAFLPSKKNLAIVNFYKFNNYEKYIPLYAIFKYKILFDCLTLNKSNSFPNGFESNDEIWNQKKYPSSAINKNFFFKQNETHKITDALEELKLLCKENNIQLICIQTPVYKSTYDTKAFEIPKTICKKLNIPFIDLSNSYIKDKMNYFYNDIHLNKNGVTEMNKLLKNEKELTNFLK